MTDSAFVAGIAIAAMAVILVTVIACATYLYGPAVREHLKTRFSVSKELLALDRELNQKAAKSERKPK